jgi:4-hydroxy-3-polyprenylbenzoate decarboxylase
MRVIVAVTAASGAIYAKQLLERLTESQRVERIALIFSENAQKVANYEGVTLPQSNKIEVMDNNNLFLSPASGSAKWDSMVICPSTVGTVGRIASGVSQSLIERAADVMLKERRTLIVVVRESPLSLIHLRNMTTLSEAGAIILPASPSFYSLPTDIGTLCQSITERIASLIGLEQKGFEWGA